MSLLGLSVLVGLAALVVWIVVRAIHLHHSIQRKWSNVGEPGVQEALTILLNSGRNGAFVIFTDTETDLFVQFRKYVDERGEAGVEMHFPRAPWSEQYYDGVQKVLRTHHVPFERVPLEGDSVVEVILASARPVLRRLLHDAIGGQAPESTAGQLRRVAELAKHRAVWNSETGQRASVMWR